MLVVQRATEAAANAASGNQYGIIQYVNSRSNPTLLCALEYILLKCLYWITVYH